LVSKSTLIKTTRPMMISCSRQRFELHSVDCIVLKYSLSAPRLPFVVKARSNNRTFIFNHRFLCFLVEAHFGEVAHDSHDEAEYYDYHFICSPNLSHSTRYSEHSMIKLITTVHTRIHTRFRNILFSNENTNTPKRKSHHG
jgi:hypothetical protein